MTNFLNLRNRVVQSLILGLVALTFYVYYCTTVNDIRSIAIAPIHGEEWLITAIDESSNTSQKNTTSRQSLKNSTSLPSKQTKSNAQESTPLLLPISPSSSIAFQRGGASTSSTSTNSQSGAVNETIVTQRLSKSIEKISITNVAPTISPRNDTSRAIYRRGHDVTVPDNCPDYGKDIDLVIIVMSAPSHINARTAIRETWGHYSQRRDVSMVFMLGSTDDARTETLLKDEEKMWGDVVRGRYHDSYANLTLKTISSLEWMNTYCSEAKFMLKTDDDMFINVPRLLDFIRSHKGGKDVIYGRLAKKWTPIRNKKSKYYVSRAEYKPAVFPNFTTGPAYLLSGNVVEKLFEAALNETYLKLEDVFVTGIVADKMGIKRSHVDDFLNRKIPFTPCKIRHAISIHMVNYGDQFDLWKILHDKKTKCKP